MKYRFSLVFLFLVLCLTTGLYAQEYLKLTQAVTIEASEAPPDQPTQNYVSYLSISPNGVKLEYGDGNILLYVNADSKFYILNTDRKEYSNVDLQIVTPFVANLNETLGSYEVTAKQTGREEKVVNWEAVIWSVLASGEKFEMDIELGISDEFEDIPMLTAFYSAMMKLQGNRAAITREMLKAKGLPVKMDIAITMDGQLFTKSVVTAEISEDPIEDVEFQIPADYKEAPLTEELFRQFFL